MVRKKNKFNEDKIKIFPGIPIPKTSKKSKFENTLRKMKVGDSFRWETSSLSGVFRCAKKVGIKLTSRRVSNYPETYQIWRKS